MVVIKTQEFDDTINDKINLLALNKNWKLVLKGSYKFKSFGYAISDIDFSTPVKYGPGLQQALIRMLDRVRKSRDFFFIYMSCGYYSDFNIPWKIFDTECYYNSKKTEEWYNNNIINNKIIREQDKETIKSLLFSDNINLTNLIQVENIFDEYFEMKWSYDDILKGYKTDNITNQKYDLIQMIMNNITVVKFGYIVYNNNNISGYVSIDQRLIDYQLPDNTTSYGYFKNDYYKLFNGFKWKLSQETVNELEPDKIKELYEKEMSKIQYENSILNSIQMLNRMIKYYNPDNLVHINNLAYFIYNDLDTYIDHVDNNIWQGLLNSDNTVRNSIISLLKNKINSVLSLEIDNFSKLLSKSESLSYNVKKLKSEYSKNIDQSLLKKREQKLACPFLPFSDNDYIFLYNLANDNGIEIKEFINWINLYTDNTSDYNIIKYMKNEDIKAVILASFLNKTPLENVIVDIMEKYKDEIVKIKNNDISTMESTVEQYEKDYSQLLKSADFNKLLTITRFSLFFGYDLYIYSNIITKILKSIDKNRNAFSITDKSMIARTKNNNIFSLRINSKHSKYEIILKKTNANVSKNNKVLSQYFREYIIGKFYVNKLRYDVPNFMGTFALFRCPIDLYSNQICMNYPLNTPYLVIEKVLGKTLINFIKSEQNQLNFNDFLIIFTQILCALSIAQTKYKFVHNDLHTKNVIISNELVDYKISMTSINKIVVFSNLKHFVKIIDFNLSDIDSDNISRKYKFIPGFDLFYFLIMTMNACYNKERAEIPELTSEKTDEKTDEKTYEIKYTLVNNIFEDLKKFVHDIFGYSVENIESVSNIIENRFVKQKEEGFLDNINPNNIFNQLLNTEKYRVILEKHISVSNSDENDLLLQDSDNYKKYIEYNIIDYKKCLTVDDQDIVNSIIKSVNRKYGTNL